MRAVVVGGGVLGTAAALALAGDGHHVVLRERAALGAGNSAKAAGILSSFAWTDPDYRLIAETRGAIGEAIALALAAGERGARNAWRPLPSIVVDRGGSPRLAELQQRVERHTEECDRMDARAAAREFPGVQFEPGEEVLVAQEDGVVEVGDLMVALRSRLSDEGVTVEENAARSVPWEGGPTEAFDAVVLAAGAWTPGLLDALDAPLPLQCYRTQLAVVGLPSEGLPIVHDLVQRCYSRPESSATMMVGDGTQLTPFRPEAYNAAADPEFLESVAQRVVRRFTDGASATMRTGWAGLCVATPDRRPMCGPVPGKPGLFVLTGDNGFGVMRCLALGQRLADTVRGRAHPDLHPGRFGADAPRDFAMHEGYAPP